MHHGPGLPDFSASVRSVIHFEFVFFHLDEAEPKKEGLTAHLKIQAVLNYLFCVFEIYVFGVAAVWPKKCESNF